jgi:LAO/AO transport system kinase
LTGDGLDLVWETVRAHRSRLDSDGELAARRRQQQVDWTWSMVHDQLSASLHGSPAVRSLVPELERQVRDGELTATLAAEQILRAFRESQ